MRIGMTQVNQKEFYELIAKLNVHPYPLSRIDPERGYTSEWKMVNSGEIIGLSDGSECFENSRYFLADNFLKSRQ